MISITRSRFSLRCLVLVASALLVACSTIDGILSSGAKVDYNKDYDFDSIRVMSVSCGLGPEDETLTPGQIERINLALSRALEQQGITVVGAGETIDAHVSWHVVVKEQSNLREYNAQSYYHCWRCGPAISSTSKVTYNEGTFVVDVIDPELSQSVWRGIMQGRLAELGDADSQQSSFDKAAEEMFARFPPGGFFARIY